MDEADFAAITVAAAGFGGGDPQRILEMPADTVENLICFLNFRAEYAETEAFLNQEKKK